MKLGAKVETLMGQSIARHQFLSTTSIFDIETGPVSGVFAVAQHRHYECTPCQAFGLDEGESASEHRIITAGLLTPMQAQCEVFQTNYNPEGVRMGNKVLRQRLRGPALAAYYPRKLATIKDVKAEFGPDLATWDDAEEDRFEYIEE